MHLTPNSIALLQAASVVMALTAVVWAAMIATRVPAMQRHRVAPQEAAHTAALRDRLPSEAMRVSDNYNHLFEAPTVFYAAVLTLVVLGTATPLDAAAAWAYAGLRVLHSIVQCTFNRVMLRFTLFVLSWLALVVLIAGAAIGAFAARL